MDTQISFLRLDQAPHFREKVQSSLKSLLEPIYGDVDGYIEKVMQGNDRVSEIMFVSEEPIGLLVYKKDLQNEYGLENAFELKTLFLFDPEQHSGKGFGTLLFKRIETIANEVETKTIYCTASSKVDNSIKCALKNGYKITKTLKEETYLLVRNL